MDYQGDAYEHLDVQNHNVEDENLVQDNYLEEMRYFQDINMGVLHILSAPISGSVVNLKIEFHSEIFGSSCISLEYELEATSKLQKRKTYFFVI